MDIFGERLNSTPSQKCSCTICCIAIEPFSGDRPIKQRETFGYKFNSGEPTEATLSYRGFKGANSQYRKTYAHSISFDIASYFNSIYHHDLVHWFERIGASSEDVKALGGFLREINSRRSIDFCPRVFLPRR